MKKYFLAAALVSLMSGAAFAQAGTPQGDSINPNPSRSASSNDKSKNPSAVIQGSQREASGTTGASTTKKKHKKHK